MSGKNYDASCAVMGAPMLISYQRAKAESLGLMRREESWSGRAIHCLSFGFINKRYLDPCPVGNAGTNAGNGFSALESLESSDSQLDKPTEPHSP